MRILMLGPLLATGLAAAASAQTVGGTYSASGTNADGSSYTGTAEITLNGPACSGTIIAAALSTEAFGAVGENDATASAIPVATCTTACESCLNCSSFRVQWV